MIRFSRSRKSHRAGHLAFSPDGNFVATAGQGLSIRMHQIQPKKLLWMRGSIPHDGRIGTLHFSPNSRYLVNQWDCKTILNVETGERTSLPQKNRNWLPSELTPGWWLRFYSTNQQWYVEYYGQPRFDGECLLWDRTQVSSPTENGRAVILPSMNPDERLLFHSRFVPLAFHPTEPILLSVYDCVGYILSLPKLEILKELKFSIPIGDIVAETHVAKFTPDGRRLLILDDTVVRMWDVPSFEEGDSFDWKLKQPMSLAISPDGLKAGIANRYGEIVIWDLE